MPLVPGLPAVSLREVEAPGVGGEPSGGARRAEVQLGGERCSERPGGATHFGWGANRTACSASQRKPLTTIRATPSARAARSIRSTPGRRRVASACPGASPAGRRSRRRPPPALRGGASFASAFASIGADRRASPVRTSKRSRTVTRTRTGERVHVRKRNPRVRRPVGVRDALRRGAPEREVRGLGEVARAGASAVGEDRLEQPRVGIVHRPRAGQRREVRRPLRPRLPSAPAGDEPEHERTEHQRHETAHHDNRGLAAVGV